MLAKVAGCALVFGALGATAVPSRITFDYPADGTLFPADITAPTFLWRDPDPAAAAWLVEIAAGGRSIKIPADGALASVGEIDARCVSSTNRLPEPSGARAWKPDEEAWATIKKRSVARPAVVTITGFRDANMKHPVSRGSVTISTSTDPAGAPIFYRDVPLMPSETRKGVIKPLDASAIPLIAWRLRYLNEPRSRLLMEGLHTCANCHSFSRDGKTLGMDMDGPQNDKGLYALVTLKPETSIRKEDIVQWSDFRGKLGGRLRVGFMSQVSPDGQYVVTTINDPGAESRERLHDIQGNYFVTNFKDYRFLQVFYATRGILAWYSRGTGKLQPLPGADDPRYVQTNAVWSPDGKYLVFARAEARDAYPPGWRPAERANDPNETQIQYDLYRIPFNDGRGGPAEPIAGASQNGMSNNFPRVSPDGRWIVFVECRNGLLMRPDSQLYIVPAAGGRARRLRANTPLMNSWHSFSPNGRWLVFASKGRSPYTQMFLTHLDDNGEDTPPVLVENATAANRAINLPEFVNIPPGGLLRIDSPASEFYRLFDAAFELGRKGDHEAAAAEWTKALALDPKDVRAHNQLGIELAALGRMNEAVAQYRKAMEIDPGDADAYTNLGIALEGAGSLDEAMRLFNKALELSPRDAKVHANLCSALAEQGQTELALAHCRTALDIDPSSVEAHNNLGMALGRAGRLEEAIPEFERALATAPDSLPIQANLGRALLLEGKPAEALPHLEKAATSPDAGALDLLAAALAGVGRFDEAVSTARRALALAERQNNPGLAAAIRARLEAYKARRK